MYQGKCGSVPDYESHLEIENAVYLAPVIEYLGCTIHLINHFPVDKNKGNKLHYPLYFSMDFIALTTGNRIRQV